MQQPKDEAMSLTIEDEQELYQVNHPFRQMLDTLFDGGLLLDGSGRIIYAGRNAFPHLKLDASRESLIREPAWKFDRESPFQEVLKTGKAVKGFVLKNALDKSNISHIVPICCKGKVMGLLCVILIDNLNSIKRMLKDVQEREQGVAGELYDAITRRETAYSFDDFIGQSAVIQEMLSMCKKAAATEYPVLITGETGTGKEIVANGIHGLSYGAGRRPFVKINCTAIPDMLLESELFGHEKGAFTGASARKKGKFELAENGTILLDEIEAMDPRLQGKLLRVLEEREFERVGGLKVLPLRARILASSNQNLKELSEQGRFREDLFYRLNIIEIRIPPLRERREDIPPLIRHFQKQLKYEAEFTGEAMGLLLDYSWRGNVRQLRNLMVKLSVVHEGTQVGKKAVEEILGLQGVHQEHKATARTAAGEIKTEEKKAPYATPKEAIDLAAEEKEQLLRALEQSGFGVTQAARLLGVSRSSVYYKMRKYGIHINR